MSVWNLVLLYEIFFNIFLYLCAAISFSHTFFGIFKICLPFQSLQVQASIFSGTCGHALETSKQPKSKCSIFSHLIHLSYSVRMQTFSVFSCLLYWLSREAQ